MEEIVTSTWYIAASVCAVMFSWGVVTVKVIIPWLKTKNFHKKYYIKKG